MHKLFANKGALNLNVTKIAEKAKKTVAKKKKTSGDMTNEELMQELAKNSARVRVIGAGGSGNNTVQRMSEVGIHGAE